MKSIGPVETHDAKLYADGGNSARQRDARVIDSGLYPTFERFQLRSLLADSQKNLHDIIEALLIYSGDHPGRRLFRRIPPGAWHRPVPVLPARAGHAGVSDPPVPYLSSMIQDPFLTRMAEDAAPGPFHSALDQIRAIPIVNPNSFIHLGWGRYRGASLACPPLTTSPSFNGAVHPPLRHMYFNPTNGLHSGDSFTDSPAILRSAARVGHRL